MPMDIAITGASGFVGARLSTDLLTAGCRVRPMVRREPRNDFEIFWNPETGKIDAAALETCPIVIHLAGENLAGRWSPERKAALRESRVRGTRLVATTLAGLARKPDLFISASAVGYYGNRSPDEICTEASDSGSGFLADMTRAWEEAASPAVKAGIRTVSLRLGVVLSPQGGMLAKILPAFRLGLGGVLGSGRQMLSWVSLDEIPRVVTFLRDHSDIRGPVNVAAPNPVTNLEFTKELGRVLRRPTVVPLPALALKVAFGQMAQEFLLGGVAVKPDVLLKNGYQFHRPRLGPALDAMF